MPKISIIVPIYNVEQYLPKCIDSILSQTFKDFEVLLVNDGSPDKCGEICDNYAKMDNRIKVIHKVNNGVSSARNKGIELSKGEYIAFIDPDDTIEPEMYDVLLQTALKNAADIVVCPIKTINFNNNTTSISAVWKDVNCSLNKNTIQRFLIPSILQEKTYSLVSCVNKLYKKSLFNSLSLRFDEQKQHSEDAKLNFTLLTLINNLVFVDTPLYNYYIYKRDSLTQIFRENLYEYVRDNKKFMLEICKKYKLEQYSGIVRNHYTSVTLSFMQDVVSRKIPIIDKNNIINEIFNDEEFCQDILMYECPSKYYMILRMVCIWGNIKLFYRIVKFKNKVQYYFHKVV
ncbi:glycosyltransferase involved in cell wall biosynthesis [Neobacillus niacini]|uniref:glycosyltransferase family 2 protein n=1 Tax=Neobacillus driksii TaxID=3035913 RepID=UPI00278A4263|nr:glycosyltransferase [Neobacillus niacini]MDQ0975379.1 glycosyltransferase involved in cell wall biosynthesis [Neobacillus niacini]